jgi:hypothetical protein
LLIDHDIFGALTNTHVRMNFSSLHEKIKGVKMFKDLSLEELKDELKILYMLQRFEGGQARDIKEVKALIKEKTPKR